MDMFQDRETAFEAKFAHDAEVQFSVKARQTQTLSLWAAGLLRKTPEQTQAYVAQLCAVDLNDPAGTALRAVLIQDLTGITDAQAIDLKMGEALSAAKIAIFDED